MVQSPGGDVFVLTSNGDNDKILRISTLETDPITLEKNESSSSVDAYWIYGLIIGAIATGILIAIIRKKTSR